MATSSMRNLSCSNERDRFGSTASAGVGRNLVTVSAKSWRRQRRVKLVVWRGTCCGGLPVGFEADAFWRFGCGADVGFDADAFWRFGRGSDGGPSILVI